MNLTNNRPEHARHCIATSEPKINEIGRNAEFLSPFNNAKTLAVVFKNAVTRSISCLLDFCSPPAVCRFVVTVIIDAVDRYASCARGLWFLSHIREKTLKFEPSFADRYPASAVVLPSRVLLVLASRNHPTPRFVCLSAIVAMGFLRTIVPMNESSRPAFYKAARPACLFHNWYRSAAAAFAKLDKMIGSHVRTSVMALVRSLVDVCASPGFAILAWVAA